MKRTVLVTGASGGLGKAIAFAFAENKDNIALCYNKNEESALNFCKTLNENGAHAQIFRADVRSERQVEKLFLQVEKQMGPVEVLVNCAGIAMQKMLCHTTIEDWEDIFATNATGTFLCSKQALATMVGKKAGCIINISSMWGQVGASCEVAYSAAKAAIIGFTKALAKELAPSGVRVNCLAPGAIDLGMMENFTQDDKNLLCQEIPLGRLGTGQELAAAAVFLASPGAGYITGQVFGVNGGFVV